MTAAIGNTIPGTAGSLDFGPALDVAAYSCASAVTQMIPENQDNFVLIDATGRAMFMRSQARQTVQIPDWPAGHVRLAVLDGMGGHGHGRQAAEAAAAGLLRIGACHSQQQLDRQLDTLHASLQAYFGEMDGGAGGRRPGTTLTLLEMAPGQAPLLYHVGDSRLYEITAQEARPLTVDHVPATTYAMQGLLDEGEWWQQVHGEHRAQISQAFILGNAFDDPQRLADPLRALDHDNLPPFLQHLGDRRSVRLRGDAVYLLASDGFWACAQPADWVAQWPALLGGHDQNGQAAPAAELVGRLFERFIRQPPPGLHVDNLTAIILHVKPSGPSQNIDETALPNVTQSHVF